MHCPHLTSPNLDGWWRMGEYNVTGILLRTFRESEIWLAYSSEDVSAPRAVQPNCAGVLRRVYSVAQVACCQNLPSGTDPCTQKFRMK